MSYDPKTKYRRAVMSNEELPYVNGYSVPEKGLKVRFTDKGKEHTATGTGEHTCYQLIGSHPGGPKLPKPKKKAPAKKPAAKKKTTKKK